MRLVQTRIHAGIWEGLLTDAGDQPDLVATHLAAELSGLELESVPDRTGQWAVRVPIPPGVLCEGVQTFLIRDRASGETLAQFSVITGEPVGDDIRAELDLLRAELDLLKQAFRRHCRETTG